MPIEMKRARKNSIKVVELFSGIGSQAKALANIGANYEVVGTCEWDIHAMCAYDAIHHGVGIHEDAKNLKKEELLEKLKPYTLSLDCKSEINKKTLRTFNLEVLRRIYSAILKNKNHVNISDLRGEDLPRNIDIMTYSFPCQDLSNVGSFHGYTKGIDRDSNSRSSLLWQVERIMLERKEQGIPLPRFLVLENLKSLLAPRHIDNFKEWKSILQGLGYHNQPYILKAEDMGSPQRRHRLIMISTFVNSFKDRIDFLKNYYDTKKNDLENPDIYKNDKKHLLEEFLKVDYDNNKRDLIEGLECQPNDTKSRRSIWENNPKLHDADGTFLSHVPTLTTKQDRHPNAGNLYFDRGNGKSKFRYLTPRECFLLMGFEESDFDAIVNNNIPARKGSQFFRRDKLIRLAGNSISVLMLEHVFKQIIDIDKGLKKLPSGDKY